MVRVYLSMVPGFRVEIGARNFSMCGWEGFETMPV